MQEVASKGVFGLMKKVFCTLKRSHPQHLWRTIVPDIKIVMDMARIVQAYFSSLLHLLTSILPKSLVAQRGHRLPITLQRYKDQDRIFTLFQADAFKAIKHAVDEESGWGVDILSISLGFEGEEPPNVDNVISNLRPRVLLFAAAANTAARNPNIAFPASIGKAICIKSADGNGSPSHRNPKNTVDAGKNFTALGQGVLSMTPMKDEWNGLRVLQKRMSGTSVATPVAAACAALVLEFIRQKDDARSTKLVEIRKAMRENMKDNIERIFLDLMTEKDGDYHFLVPHKLLKRHPDLGGKERDEVAHAIYTCLKTH